VTRLLVRFVLVACCASALLAGCGRKGPLDLPPSATAGPAPIGPDGKPMGAMDTYGQPQAPPGPKKHIFLDNLID
jgi:predicted small lipoprotein YifL